MRHATPETLATLAGFIAELRDVDGLIEKRPGAFSRGSRAFLHFHDDPTGIDADVRVTTTSSASVAPPPASNARC